MKTNETISDTLTLPQDFAILVSNVSQKELDFFIEDDSEFLHEFRVELRKLRTWSQIFETAFYRVKKLKKHLAQCHLIGSDLRNFDVLLAWIDNNGAFASPQSKQALQLQRKKLRKKFIKELVKTDAISTLRRLSRQFLFNIKGITKEEFAPYVKQYIEEKKNAIYTILPQAVEDLVQLHEVRKMLKKIRYALLLLPVIDANCLKNLKELQDILGYINDRRVWIEIVQTHLKEVEGAEALGSIFHHEMEEKLNTFRAYIESGKIFVK